MTKKNDVHTHSQEAEPEVPEELKKKPTAKEQHYQDMLEFVKWAYEWSRFNDHNIRMKTTKLLQNLGEVAEQ